MIGYVIKINDKRESYYHRYMDHAVTILLNMLPSEKELEPDIVLTLDTDEIEAYANIINNLHKFISFFLTLLFLILVGWYISLNLLKLIGLNINFLNISF